MLFSVRLVFALLLPVLQTAATRSPILTVIFCSFRLSGWNEAIDRLDVSTSISAPCARALCDSQLLTSTPPRDILDPVSKQKKLLAIIRKSRNGLTSTLESASG